MHEQQTRTDGARNVFVTVPPENDGERLDRMLTARLAASDAESGLSRARVQALIRGGAVTCDQRSVFDPNAKVRVGETYRLTIEPPTPPGPTAQPIPLNILYEDSDLVVIDKPAGLVVHPGAGNPDGTLVNALISHCGASLSGIGGVRRPGIVHRLDKDTSGVLVVAKTDQAHQGLSEQFQAHGADGRLQRQYLGLVWGVPRHPQGVIDAPLARSPTNRMKFVASRRADARHAVTHYRTMRDLGMTSLLALELETGRTHQIRVHLAHLGHPLIGDPTYGSGHKTRAVRLPEAARRSVEGFRRQALHAAMLGFEHPRTKRQLRFQAPLPADLAQLLATLESGK
jgi:23S rRNA pseudouridine1911/1915/1917 synthase